MRRSVLWRLWLWVNTVCLSTMSGTLDTLGIIFLRVFIPSLSLNWILSLFAVGNLESNIPLQQILSAKLLPVNDYFNVPVLYSNEGKKHNSY